MAMLRICIKVTFLVPLTGMLGYGSKNDPDLSFDEGPGVKWRRRYSHLAEMACEDCVALPVGIKQTAGSKKLRLLPMMYE